MKFIVQSNIAEHDYLSFKDAIKKAGAEFESFYHKPFDTRYPVFDTNKPTFIYAASSVTDTIFNDNKDKFVGVYNHTIGINIHNFYDNKPDLMWSPRAYYGTISSVLRDLEKTDDLVFSRPAIDDKLFAGQVTTQSDLIDFCESMLKADPCLCNNEIFIGGYKPPYYEYRLFVVNGKLVTSSLYRVAGLLQIIEGSPKKVNELAELFGEVHKDILPSSYVIDIATTEYEADIGVIEVNCINNSGFYAIDKSKLVDALINN